MRTMAEQPVVGDIYRQLEQEIVGLYILPGETLSENQLCSRFGVSRTPIRSVLQRLEHNGFVQIIPHRGTIVTPINLHIANQMIYQRVAVETMVLRDFVRTATPIEVEQVRYAQQQLLLAGQDLSNPEHFDINHFLDVDLRMHQLWFHFTDKDFLWELLSKPQADYARFIRLDIVGAKNVPDVLKDHREMMRIIDEKDAEAIEPLISHHLYGGVRRLGDKIFSSEYSRYFNPL